jgi:DNA-binding NarL/FixJ family response regulator
MAAGQSPYTVGVASEVNTRTDQVRLLLVDDNPAVLRQVIQLLPGEFEVVATLEDGAGLCGAVQEHRPDIIVLDITLPSVSGIALASQLRNAGYSTRIVFLTVHSDPDYVRAALAAGATAYVVKMRLSLDLVPALRSALQDERFISPSPELEGME